MADGRSKRSHKKVNYSTFGEDDDDDFADLTPPTKKAKLSTKPCSKDKPSKKDNHNKENSLQKKAVHNAQEKKSKSRKAPDEKAYDRDLLAALELSLQESQDSETDTEFNVDSAQHAVGNKEHVIQIDMHRERLDVNTADNDKPPVLSAVNNELEEAMPNKAFLNTELLTEKDSTSELADHSITPAVASAPVLQPVNSHVDSSDEIEILESVQEKSSRRRATTTKKAVIVDEDSDFDLDAEDDDDFEESDDSDDDYNGSDSDEDFSKKKGKAAKGKAATGKGKKQSTPKPKSAATPKITTKATSVSKTTAKTKSTSVKKSAPLTSSISRSALSSPTPRSVGGGLPKWTPPASVGNNARSPSSGVSVKSPSSGLRLGLSRNQRVKPLHSGCKVQQ